MRFCLGFVLCGTVLAALAVRLARMATGGWWALVAVELYLSICLLALAAAYGLRGAGVAVEEHVFRAGWSVVTRAVLLPYTALGAIVLYLARWFDSEGLLNPVMPGIYIGRLPFPYERPRLREAGIRAVLNVCWEFPRLSGADREPEIETVSVPILDGSPPTDQQFGEAIGWVARWRAEGRCVLVHCAQGHGRSATVLAAILVRLGLATDAEQALSMVSAARPRAMPSREQREALNRYTSRWRAEPAPGVAPSVDGRR
jgi:hypothetical protein